MCVLLVLLCLFELWKVEVDVYVVVISLDMFKLLVVICCFSVVMLVVLMFGCVVVGIGFC